MANKAKVTRLTSMTRKGFFVEGQPKLELLHESGLIYILVGGCMALTRYWAACRYVAQVWAVMTVTLRTNIFGETPETPFLPFDAEALKVSVLGLKYIPIRRQDLWTWRR